MLCFFCGVNTMQLTWSWSRSSLHLCNVFRLIILNYELGYGWNLVGFLLIVSFCREKVNIPPLKSFISIEGEGADSTIVQWGDTADTIGPNGKPLGTFSSATFAVNSPYFMAQNITFKVPIYFSLFFCASVSFNYTFYMYYISPKVPLIMHNWSQGAIYCHHSGTCMNTSN